MRGSGLRSRGPASTHAAPSIRQGKCSECKVKWAFEGALCRDCVFISKSVFLPLSPKSVKPPAAVDITDNATGLSQATERPTGGLTSADMAAMVTIELSTNGNASCRIRVNPMLESPLLNV
jgi:hypothetical protein